MIEGSTYASVMRDLGEEAPGGLLRDLQRVVGMSELEKVAAG